MKLQSKTAFTLVELLIVVTIIVVLMALLLPALSSARDQAKLVSCLANIRTAGLAIHTYAADNNGWIPPYTMSTRCFENWPLPIPPFSLTYQWDARILTNYIYPSYVSAQSAFYCPSDRFHKIQNAERLNPVLDSDGNWPQRISYNYFENPINRSQVWQEDNPDVTPHMRVADRYPTLIIYYDNASWVGGNTPLMTHHPKGNSDLNDYNSRGGNRLNFLTIDGSGHTFTMPFRYLGGDLSDWASPTNRNIVQLSDLPQP